MTDEAAGPGCSVCFGADAEALWRARPWAEVAALVEDSHFSVRIVGCPDCRQQFVKLFSEFVAWSGDGDDAQHWDVLPVSAAEARELTAQGEQVSLPAIEALSEGRRRLQVDHPSSGPHRIAWAHGRLWILPGR